MLQYNLSPTSTEASRAGFVESASEAGLGLVLSKRRGGTNYVGL